MYFIPVITVDISLGLQGKPIQVLYRTSEKWYPFAIYSIQLRNSAK